MAIRDVAIGDKHFSIAYEIVRPNLEHKILFLHGWGSNKEIMKQAFGELFEDYALVFVDMPGFGKSTNNYVLATYDYAEIIKEFLKSINITPYGIIGHSFGGKVSAMINPKKLALLGSSGIVLEKPLSVKIKILISKAAKAFGISSSLRKIFASDDAKDMSPQMYETFKIVVDEDFSKHFSLVTSKTALIWGINDTASPVVAGETISKLIRNSILSVIAGNHFFFLKSAKDTQDLILKTWS